MSPQLRAMWVVVAALTSTTLLAQSPASVSRAPLPVANAQAWQAKLMPPLGRALADDGEVGCILSLHAADAGIEPLVLSRAATRWIASTTDDLQRAHDSIGLREVRRYSHLPLVAVRVPGRALAELAADPRIEAITPIRKARAFRTQGTALMRVANLWALGYDGAGVTVAVLDTGVDYTHAELSPVDVKVINLADTIDNDGDAMDLEGHGTNAAGVIAGSTGGVAPAATIAAVRVLDIHGEGTSDQILAGLDAVLASVAAGNPHNIRVANLSFGGYDDEVWPPSQGSCDTISPDFAAAFSSLTSAGVLVAVAAGNGACTTGVAWPACISSAYAVGSVYDATMGGWTYSDLQCSSSSCTDSPTRADQIPCYSDSGTKLAFLAPADCATTPMLNGGNVTCFNGTSAAVAYASGAAALLFQAFPGQPVGAVATALQTTGKPITDPRNSLTRNRIDVVDALAALAASCPTPATPAGLAAAPSSLCGSQTLDLSWSAVAEANSYTVEIASSPDFSGAQSFSVGTSSMAYTPNFASPVSIHARVRAHAECGSVSPWSATAASSYQPQCAPIYSRTYFVSGIGHTRGVHPAFWYSDLSVLNQSQANAELRLTFYGRSTAGPATRTLGSRQQVSWNDVLVDLFSVTGEDVGAIVVESTELVIVLARTYSRIDDACAGKEGSYGQSYQGLEVGDSLAAGQVGLLAGLRSDGSFRTNVEFVNVSQTRATVEVRFFDSTGTALGPPLSRQVSPNHRVGVTAALPAGISSAWAELIVSPLGARVVAYASVIDGTSSDPTTVPLAVTGTAFPGS